MLKRLLMTAAILCLVGNTFAYAQDFFISFDENSRVDTQTIFPGGSGSIFIFADEAIDFNQLDLVFNIGNIGDFLNRDIVTFTGGVVYNPGGFPRSGTSSSTNGGAFTSFDLLDLTATEGRIFATSFLSPGQRPGFNASNFRAGANGFLLAQVDFDIVGDGFVDFSLILGDLGAVNDGVGPLEGLTFGSAMLATEGLPLVCAPNILGDVNRNGVVSFVDIPPFISILISGGYQEQADCDFNGAVDFFDIPEFISILISQ